MTHVHIDQSQGKYGCKRFLRDGYQTVKEVRKEHMYLPYCISPLTPLPSLLTPHSSPLTPYLPLLQDPHRLHYEPAELKMFANIECEWPLFTELLLLDAIIRGNGPDMDEYRQQLEKLVLRKPGEEDVVTVPELYYVPKDKARPAPPVQ